MYQPLSVHTQAKGTRPARSAAPSQGATGRGGLPLRVFPSNPLPGAPSNRNERPRFAVVRPTKIPKVASTSVVYERVSRAVRKAFPNGRFTPRWAGGAQTAWDARHDLEVVYDAWKTTQEALTPEEAYWQGGGARATRNVVNPGLTNLGAWTHSLYNSYPTDYVIPAGWGRAVSIGNPASLPQNTWLLSVLSTSATAPSGYLDDTHDGSPVPAGYYYREPNLPEYHFRQTTLKYWYASSRVWRNNTAQPLPPRIDEEIPLFPLGQPLPATMPKGYPMVPNVAPLARPRAARRPLPRPRRYDEVAIELAPDRVVVRRTTPRGPGNAKETKAWGKASAAASVAFYLYEATDDVADWISIAVNAIPDAPNWVRGANPTTQVAWLLRNPEKLAQARWDVAAWAFAAWAIDEAFGAAVGQVNKRANRGISTGGFTVDMRTNAPVHYAPGGASSPGTYATEFIRAFL